MLDLSLSDDQEQIRAAFRSLFQRQCDADCVRQAEPLGHSADLWAKVIDLGAADMAVPEESGGGGAQLLDAALVCETAGEFLAPVPLVETMVANRLLARLGTAEARSILTEVIDAGSVVTVALSKPAGGVVRWVPAGAVAARVIVLDGSRVVVVSGPAHAQAANLGSLPLAHVAVEGGEEIAAGGEAVGAFHRAVDEWRVLTAAVLSAAGQRSLEIAVAYTTDRKAFGVPIASYQSVAHGMADLATALRGAQLLTRKSAWAAHHDPPERSRLALMAYSFAATTAERAATDALHFHGGYGFMLEYDIQLYFRRIKAWSLLDGDPAGGLQRLAAELWGPPADRPPADGTAAEGQVA
jgi:alkylation response protein AidB-like acyl-CoA dehydrogenase